MAVPQSPFANRLIAGATAPQVQVPYRPVQTQTPAPVAPVQNQAEMLRQRAFQAALARPDMPIPPEFSTGSALGDEQERLRARYALMRDAGRSAVAERARAQGRSVTYDEAGNPVIGDMPQTPIVQAGPEGTRIAYRNGIPVGFSTPTATPPAQRPITPTAPMPAEMAQVRSRATGLAAERAAQVLRDAAIAAAAPVAATTAAAPAAAVPVAAAAAAPAVRAAVPAPRQPAATPPTPVQFTPEEIMDPESAALEQQAAAVLEQERLRPIQAAAAAAAAAADAQTREYIRTRAARIADLQKATIARDPAKIQTALDSLRMLENPVLRMLKEPVLRQPRTATPEPAALPPGSEGYEMSQLLGARPMTSQELSRLTPSTPSTTQSATGGAVATSSPATRPPSPEEIRKNLFDIAAATQAVRREQAASNPPAERGFFAPIRDFFTGSPELSSPSQTGATPAASWARRLAIRDAFQRGELTEAEANRLLGSP